MLVLRKVLVVTPTADGNSVDVDYEVSDARLDVWAQRHGVPPVHTPFLRASMPTGDLTASLWRSCHRYCMFWVAVKANSNGMHQSENRTVWLEHTVFNLRCCSAVLFAKGPAWVRTSLLL